MWFSDDHFIQFPKIRYPYHSLVFLWHNEPASRGGSLFLKVLLDQVTTTGEANLRQLIHITETYSIKTNCPGEDIQKVSDLLGSIYDSLNTIRKEDLPPDSVSNLLKILQTTSVPNFNNQFRKMGNDLANQEIQRAINSTFNYSLGNSDLKNDIKTIKWTLEFADRYYVRLKEDGTWNKCLQRPPGKSFFLAHDQAGEAKGSPPDFVWSSGCFNYGENHNLKDCPHTKDTSRISRNKPKHPFFKKNAKQRQKYRRPEPHENNRRINFWFLCSAIGIVVLAPLLQYSIQLTTNVAYTFLFNPIETYVQVDWLYFVLLILSFSLHVVLSAARYTLPLFHKRHSSHCSRISYHHRKRHRLVLIAHYFTGEPATLATAYNYHIPQSNKVKTTVGNTRYIAKILTLPSQYTSLPFTDDFLTSFNVLQHA